MDIRRATEKDAAGIAAVQVLTWQDTYQGIVADAYLQEMSIVKREKKWKKLLVEQNDIVYVAVDNERIIGFISGGRSRSPQTIDEGELYAIYILPHYQKRGIGSLLMNHLIQDLQHVYAVMLIWVLQDNPSKRAYEKLGAVKEYERWLTIGEQSLKAEGYVLKVGRNS
ncbi:FR47 domain-containing protein [Fictibacillus macauensis ZFHKF-1]|uniref:FR47 domain-containing protein n=1 Tax=Fictibacillus macauensis ZFHKF-1 TaxID=1196324 RepID=I8UJR3_9BACL|nr:GNAT family N-acetyltransferase [Fictibacillus macauensis]EIT87115.1 FR47 domain-containing protein [Fictibacillus macauensis ZFHKF-1]